MNRDIVIHWHNRHPLGGVGAIVSTEPGTDTTYPLYRAPYTGVPYTDLDMKLNCVPIVRTRTFIVPTIRNRWEAIEFQRISDYDPVIATPIVLGEDLVKVHEFRLFEYGKPILGDGCLTYFNVLRWLSSIPEMHFGVIDHISVFEII